MSCTGIETKSVRSTALITGCSFVWWAAVGVDYARRWSPRDRQGPPWRDHGAAMAWSRRRGRGAACPRESDLGSLPAQIGHLAVRAGGTDEGWPVSPTTPTTPTTSTT